MGTMPFLTRLIERARQLDKFMVLPEGSDPRCQEAARIMVQKRIGRPLLLGPVDAIRKARIAPEEVAVRDPLTDGEAEEITRTLYERLERRGVSMDEARKLASDSLWFGAALLLLGKVDGALAGASHTSPDTLRAALRVIGAKKGARRISSCFVMVLPDIRVGHQGAVLYADGGVIPNPGPEELEEITIQTAETARLLLEAEPVAALLSFSTKGSADSPSVAKVQEALSRLKKSAPSLLVDGELQADAALLPAVALRKAPDSPVAGKVNILIFPNLDAGNIASKLTERLGGATALGPVLQGLGAPDNDLSRGCNASDIAYPAAITAIQAGAAKAQGHPQD